MWSNNLRDATGCSYGLFMSYGLIASSALRWKLQIISPYLRGWKTGRLGSVRRFVSLSARDNDQRNERLRRRRKQGDSENSSKTMMTKEMILNITSMYTHPVIPCLDLCSFTFTKINLIKQTRVVYSGNLEFPDCASRYSLLCWSSDQKEALALTSLTNKFLY